MPRHDLGQPLTVEARKFGQGGSPLQTLGCPRLRLERESDQALGANDTHGHTGIVEHRGRANCLVGQRVVGRNTSAIAPLIA